MAAELEVRRYSDEHNQRVAEAMIVLMQAVHAGALLRLEGNTSTRTVHGSLQLGDWSVSMSEAGATVGQVLLFLADNWSQRPSPVS